MDSFLEIAACPTCRSPLQSADGGYRCDGPLAHVWPIKRGIPRFVSSEDYARNFGFQWRRYKRTQLDRALKVKESEITFREKTGLTPDDVRGKRVLDVGVGTGRFSDVIARWGGSPFGCDLSLAVETARENLAPYPQAFVAQANLFNLPFRPRSFDIVFSIGVLHHTPDTFAATKAILDYLKPGGIFAIWVYEKSFFQKYSDFYRRWTPGMNQELLHLLSHAAIPYYHLLKFFLALPQPVGELLRDHAHWYFPTSVHDDPIWRVLDTFDWVLPRYQWKHTREELLEWFRGFGLEEIQIQPKWPTACRGRLPLGSASRPIVDATTPTSARR